VSLTIDALRVPDQKHSGDVPVTLAMADYDRTRPLIDGRVKAKGLAVQGNTSWIGDFCVRPVYEDYDAAEMSLSWYVMARVRGEPVVALPVFPLRMPVLAYVFVREDSPYTQPKDLAGKRVATILYRITVNLWLRGIFHEHYGLAPGDVSWVVTEGTEGAGFNMPSGIKLRPTPRRKSCWSAARSMPCSSPSCRTTSLPVRRNCAACFRIRRRKCSHLCAARANCRSPTRLS
jgi:hypothetical protein